MPISPAETGEPKDYNVYFRSSGRQSELAEYLDASCRRLLGSDVYADREGEIYWISWHDISPEGLLPNTYVMVSKLHPQADIYAPHTRYHARKEMRISQINDDREEPAGVEKAIRAMDHILEGERGRETRQAHAVGLRATELLGVFSQGFLALTNEEFETQRRETFELLERVKLNPGKVVSEEKRRMAQWLMKGSFGKDYTGRLNWLISAGAIAAAHRRAVSRHLGISRITAKYAAMREALQIEREFSREIFRQVAARLRPTAIPATAVFKHLNRMPTTQEVNITLAILRTMRFQLAQPHVKTYRPIGRTASSLLQEIGGLLKGGRRAEIVDRNVFGRAYELIAGELEKQKTIYPRDERLTDS